MCKMFLYIKYIPPDPPRGCASLSPFSSLMSLHPWAYVSVYVCAGAPAHTSCHPCIRQCPTGATPIKNVWTRPWLAGFQLFRADRHTELSRKTKAGGICFYINCGWCNDVTVIQQYCSPDLEYFLINCKPFYSPRAFASFR